MLADPPKWQSELEDWQERYGKDAEGNELVQAFDTNQARTTRLVCSAASMPIG